MKGFIVKINIKALSLEKHFSDSPDIAMVVGYLVISRPFLDPTNQRHVNSTYSERLEVSMHEHVQKFCLMRLIYFIFRKQYLIFFMVAV